VKIRFALSVGLGAPHADMLSAVVTGAEERGFDGLWFSDVPLLPATDPFLAVAFAAARSTRLKLGVNLVPFGHQPFVFARQVAQLDQLTGGRLLVTLVPGLDHPGERAALGIGPADRGRLMDALLPDLRRWWAGEGVSVAEGVDPVALAVLPAQSPLEVWLGGSGPKAIRRAGRLADGWLGSLVTPEQAGAIRREIQHEAEAAERSIDPEHFGLSIPYAREPADLNDARLVSRVRPGDPVVVPVGAAALRVLIMQLTDQGLSKFVVRSVAPVRSWPDELDFLAATLLDLQT
jgi:probable F420-dependent oxidoreductase